VPKVCQNPMFFESLGLVSSEEHIPQVNENTEKAKCVLVVLESAVTRPRQARYYKKHGRSSKDYLAISCSPAQAVFQTAAGLNPLSVHPVPFGLKPQLVISTRNRKLRLGICR
jgi:hypothetical protein